MGALSPNISLPLKSSAATSAELYQAEGPTSYKTTASASAACEAARMRTSCGHATGVLKEGSFYIDPGLGLSSIFAKVPDDQSSGLASRRLKANVRMDIVDVRISEIAVGAEAIGD